MSTELMPPAPGARTFSTTRLVRLGDAAPDARLRLDALARYLQDVASDDSRDAEFEGVGGGVWVVRRTVVEVTQWPRLYEPVTLTTFLGGTGGRWAERRTSVTSPSGGRVEAAALWVFVDRVTGFPKAVPPGFTEVWGDAGGRKVSGRLSHPAPPSEGGASRRAWPTRSTDFDVLAHVNNAAYWEALEDELDRRGAGVVSGGRFELEYRTPIEPHHDADLLSVAGEDGSVLLWLVAADVVHASASWRPTVSS